MRLVPELIAMLAERAPGLRVDLRQLTSTEQAAGLLAGALDVGLVRDPEPHAGLALRDVLEEAVHAVVPASHRLAGRGRVDLAELAQEPFVLWRRAGAPVFFDRLITACRAAGFSPEIAYEIRGIQARLGLVAAGLGVSLEAASYARSRGGDVRFIPLADPPIPARLQLAWRRGSTDPRVELVLRIAGELADQAPASTSSLRRSGATPPAPR